MKLYTFFRSSASYRVRIVLNHKGLDYEQIPIHLRRGGGEQLSPEYKAVNPHGLVPTLEEGGRYLTQSLAIIEYLEERNRISKAKLPSLWNGTHLFLQRQQTEMNPVLCPSVYLLLTQLELTP